MQSEMGALIQRHGGVPYSAPVLQEIYLKDTPEVSTLVDDLCQGNVEVVVLQTGVGTRALFEAAASQGREEELLAALDQLTVIARSPKPASVLRRYKIHIDVMPPEPFTSEDLLQAIHGMKLQGKKVAIQAYGGPNNLLAKTLRERGASVQEVSLYTWGLPEDLSPVHDLIGDLSGGKIAAIAFTSQPQVGNLLEIASQVGKENHLLELLNSQDVVVASVGPVCTRRLIGTGIKVDVEPDHPHMGNLVMALAEHLNPGESET